MLNPYITKDAGGVYWLHWTPDPTAEGYAFTTPGGQGRTFDPTRHTAKLGKWSEPVRASVAALDVTKRAAEVAYYPSNTPPPPSGKTGLGQNVMFTAWNPHAGLAIPGDGKHKLAISADVHCGGQDIPPEVYVPNAVSAAAQARAKGCPVACWGNQLQLGVQQIQDFGQTIGADYPLYQSENQDEMVALGIALDGTLNPGSLAADAGALRPLVHVGNPNGWTARQRETATALIGQNRMVLIFETYTCQGDPWPADSSSAGVPFASECVCVGWGSYPYQLPDYKSHVLPAQWPLLSVYLAEDMTSASWSILP